jgi:xanthine dehydrogenase small subunit
LIRLILNDKELATDLKPGTILLDFIRYHRNLKGTKIGCREGDCGACTILVGQIINGELEYTSATSCLMPLGNAHAKHIVTVEGLNMERLNPIQQAMCEENGTQCGFCTPGFVVSLAGFCLSRKEPTKEKAIAAVDGNICRCTGYKSIERAAGKIAEALRDKKNQEPCAFVSDKEILPAYFKTIRERLVALQTKTNGVLNAGPSGKFVGGGTDLYVQQHDTMPHAKVDLLFDKKELNGIYEKDGKCFIGAAATVTDLHQASFLEKYFPGLDEYIKLISSTPIRNMATIAGNFANASPIGDLTIFFLALDARIILNNTGVTRELALKDFYKGYKQLDKHPGEYIERIWFPLPAKNTTFNFEKVSKRTNLDIASVNSALTITTDGNVITAAGLSAGGVGPVPMYLRKSVDFMTGKKITEALVAEVITIVDTEISPISDARGTAAYKRLLLGQLIKAHFIKLFPALAVEELLYNGTR